MTFISFHCLEARDQLRKWREVNERRSEEIVDLWISCLGANAAKLGDESPYYNRCGCVLSFKIFFMITVIFIHLEWMILEQVAVASLDTHNITIGEDLIMELKERFPKSDRVRLVQKENIMVNEEFILILNALIK